jgi:hypothetical protein
MGDDRRLQLLRELPSRRQVAHEKILGCRFERHVFAMEKISGPI